MMLLPPHVLLASLIGFLLLPTSSATGSATAPLAPGAVGLAPAPPRVGAETLLVSTEWLARHLADRHVVVVRAGHHTEDDFAREHIPGARYLSYMDIATPDGPVPTELPPVAQLARAFERVGVADGTRVVLYGDPMSVARAFFSLDYLGHPRVAVLDGGLRKWKADGRPVTAEAAPAARGTLTPHPRPEIVARADWVRARLGDPRVALLDTRTVEEFEGRGSRRGLPSDGHLPGARHLEWEQLLSDTDDTRFRDRRELAELFRARGVAQGDTVITYCLVGMRASLSYFVARYLGYSARMYDGSYAEWSARGLPLVRGSEPGR